MDMWVFEPTVESHFPLDPHFLVCDSHVNKAMHILSCMSP